MAIVGAGLEDDHAVGREEAEKLLEGLYAEVGPPPPPTDADGDDRYVSWLFGSGFAS